jgi:alanine racemase
MPRAWADVDLDAIRHNVRALAALAAPAKVCAVVKADGYGHGATAVARAALEAGATWLGVAQHEEAFALRDAGIAAPILLLSEPQPSHVADAVDLDLRFTVYTPLVIRRLQAAAAVARRTIPVHLKVDTGMHRVGASPDDIPSLVKAIHDRPGLALEGFWTHCAIADEPDDPFTATQLARFDAMIAELAADGVRPPILHAANSAAAIAHPASRYDLVRCGIAIYGIPPSAALAGRADLRPALTLRSEVAFVKQVAAGERVSYGLRHQLDRDTTLATLPIGYADGVFRSLPAAGQEVLIGGRRCPMVGVVTMDQVMVDVGPGASVSAGDEVVLIGAQGDERIAPDEWADRLGTIAYEVVCAIGPRVHRRYP